MQSKACLGYAEVQPAFDDTSKLELRSALRSACSLFYNLPSVRQNEYRTEHSKVSGRHRSSIVDTGQGVPIRNRKCGCGKRNRKQDGVFQGQTEAGKHSYGTLAAESGDFLTKTGKFAGYPIEYKWLILKNM